MHSEALAALSFPATSKDERIDNYGGLCCIYTAAWWPPQGGIVAGPLGICRLLELTNLVFPDINSGNLAAAASLGRIGFMFLIGLELDPIYIRRTGKKAASIALAGAGTCFVMAAVFLPVFLKLTRLQGDHGLLSLVFVLLMASTSSPVLIRMVSEFNLASTEVGRLSVSAAIINDLVCLLVAGCLAGLWKQISVETTLAILVWEIGLVAVAVYNVRPLVRRLNRRKPERHYLTNGELSFVIICLLFVFLIGEVVDHSTTASSLLLGISFPREGRTSRTIIDKLSYPVNSILLPVYFAHAGIQMDLSQIRSMRLASTVAVMVGLSLVGKVVGSLAAATWFHMTPQEGLVMGFLLNVKGHINLILMNLTMENKAWDSEMFVVMLLSTVVIPTIITGPVVTFVIRSERKAKAYQHIGMQWEKPESELRISSCLHNARNVPTMVNIIEASRGSTRWPVTVYAMHLVELLDKRSTNLIVYPGEEDEGERSDAKQITVALDAYTQVSGVPVRRVTAVSYLSSLHEDVCKAAEDTLSSIVILPFHKHQRVDGRMESTHDAGFQRVNQKVLRQSPCSIGILVDRGFRVMSNNHVAALFFGGHDDREALAFGGRMAEYPGLSFTVIRFLFSTTTTITEGCEDSSDQELDDMFLSSFLGRLADKESVSYVEKYVDGAEETVNALRGLGGLYSLFIVGKGDKGSSSLTLGLTDWEECPELGPIGDILASNDFSISGSVLVIQQRNPSKTNSEMIDDFSVS